MSIRHRDIGKVAGKCIFSLLLLLLSSLISVVWAAPVNDAYRYEDSFADNTGIDLTSTGFVNFGGAQTAKSKNNELISGCFGLAGPAGSTFTGWSFAEFVVDDLTQVNGNQLYVESCSGATIYTTTSLPTGISSIDLSSVVPVSVSRIRFRWNLKYQSDGGSRTARISNWRALGTTSGATTLQITPSQTTINSNSDISFSVGIGSNGVATKNPRLTVNLNAINGSPAIGSAGVGLATDATVCYDLNSDGTAGIPASECQRYRPLEFLSASDGTSGETAQTTGLSTPVKVPAAGGPTDGAVIWDLNDLPDGYAGSISVNLHIPKGYVDGKTLAMEASMAFGESSGDGSLNNYQAIVSKSPTVTVNSLHNGIIRVWSPYGNIAPGANNLYDNYYVRNNVNQTTNPSDLENIELTVQANSASSCVPDFRSAVVSTRYNWPSKLTTPPVGAPLDNNNVTVTFFRASYVSDSSNARLITRYDVPANCANGTRVRTQGDVGSPAPLFSDSATRTHNVIFDACRSGYNHMHRIQTGLLVENNYALSPGWPEYYINNGSLRSGEYFSTWSPYGDSTYRTHTTVLEKTYAIINVPATTTFHGYRTRSREDTDSKIYFFKDPTGSAPDPSDPAFNNSFDPATQVPANGWYEVKRTWSGPFTSYTGTSTDHSDPAAIAGPGSRILVVKTNDNTSSGASDFGMLRPQAVWRVCDGSFGCAAPAAGQSVRVTGNVFTYQQTQSPFVRSCAAISGYRAFVGQHSYPKVYSFAAQQNVQAGGVASIILNPHNTNHASQYVDGHWSFDLSQVASNIDLDNVTGELLTSGVDLPAPNQNIEGQTCNVTDIAFVAPTAANPIAYWNIPPRCQIPNGWGYRIDNTTSQDHYVQAYRLKLNVPVKTTTTAGTVLNFPAQIRTTDLSTLGADNAVATNRWAASNYESIAAVTVLENPTIAATKTAPAGWPVNSTFTYALSIENQGNTPLFGYYLSDQLPRTGVNGSEFDPDYGEVFVNRIATDIMLETSVDTLCNSAPQSATWDVVSLSASSRSGYQSQSDVLNAATRCIRLRRSATGASLAVGERINMAIDISIPDDVFLSGKSLHNKALTGVSDAFGGTSNVSSTETTLVTTTVDGAVVLGADKTTTASLDHPQQVGWKLGYRNASGTVATTVTVSDTLPSSITYNGLMTALASGVSCANGTAGDINNDGIIDCALIDINPDGTGGTLELTVAELGPDDGNPTGGNDQGEAGIWTFMSVDTPVENCVLSIPPGGVGGRSCTYGSLSDATIVKSQQVSGGRTGTVPPVYFGESIAYSLVITNTGTLSRYVSLEDTLPFQTSYLPGTLTINGASASDNLINNGTLTYQSALVLAPAEKLEISYTVTVSAGMAGQLINNDAVFMMCADKLSTASCSGARASNTVQSEIQGQTIAGTVFTDNGSGSALAHDGDHGGTESGVAQIAVSVTHSDTGVVVANGFTDESGTFVLYANLTTGESYKLAAQIDNQRLPVSHHKGNTQASGSVQPISSLTFTHAVATTSYDSVRFGVVDKPLLKENEQRSAVPAQTVLIPHEYRVTTSGLLHFDLTEAQAIISLSDWQVSLYADTDCSQTLEATDPLISEPIPVDPDISGTLCLLYSLHVPGPIQSDLDLHVPLTAQLVLSDDAVTGHGLIHQALILDSITISAGETGRLILNKRVVNLTRGGSDGTSNTGLPGDVLRYTISYEVTGETSIQDVYINDTTPVYTLLQVPISCPSAAADCVVIKPVGGQNNNGYSGPLQWKLADTLAAGTEGSVRFDVLIE